MSSSRLVFLVVTRKRIHFISRPRENLLPFLRVLSLSRLIPTRGSASLHARAFRGGTGPAGQEEVEGHALQWFRLMDGAEFLEVEDEAERFVAYLTQSFFCSSHSPLISRGNGSVARARDKIAHIESVLPEFESRHSFQVVCNSSCLFSLEHLINVGCSTECMRVTADTSHSHRIEG